MHISASGDVGKSLALELTSARDAELPFVDVDKKGVSCEYRGHAYRVSAEPGEFAAGDALLFGPETRGLPQEVLDALPDGQRLRLPMKKGNRSLNLSNAAAVVVYEAWRQLGFAGGA